MTPLTARIHDFIRLGGQPPEDFSTLALDLFRWQAEHNPAYAAICGEQRPTTVEEIPAVPAGLFRDLPLTCFPPQEATVSFHTSGTTGHPGVHRMRDTVTYDLSASTWYRACFPHTPPVLSLVAAPTLQPHSSLAHMVATLFPQAHFTGLPGGELDVDSAARWLSRAAGPVFIAGTALTLHQLLDGLPTAPHLAPGSRVMVTGGFKGQEEAIDAQRLFQHVGQMSPHVLLLGEYGMTELRSQLWTLPSPPSEFSPEGPFQPPPWMRVFAIDPASGRVLPVGSRGQLRFLDLANHDTVAAIETLDEGTVLPDGGVLLHGRLRGAPPRGCSLATRDIRVST